MAHRQLKYNGTTEILGKTHIKYESEGEDFVFIEDPVSTNDVLIREDAAKLLKSDLAHPKFHPLLEEDLVNLFMVNKFYLKNREQQIRTVRVFLRSIFKFASTRIGDLT